MLAAVLVALPGQLVPAAQKGATDTSGDDMEIAGLAFSNDVAAGIGHVPILACVSRLVHQKSPRSGPGNF